MKDAKLNDCSVQALRTVTLTLPKRALFSWYNGLARHFFDGLSACPWDFGRVAPSKLAVRPPCLWHLGSSFAPSPGVEVVHIRPGDDIGEERSFRATDAGVLKQERGVVEDAIYTDCLLLELRADAYVGAASVFLGKKEVEVGGLLDRLILFEFLFDFNKLRADVIVILVAVCVDTGENSSFR